MKLSTVTNQRWLFEAPNPNEYSGLQAQIANWLQHHNITNFTINADNTVDVPGDVHFLSPRFKKLPFQFGVVGGDIVIAGGTLTSSWGLPKTMAGSLIWSCESSDQIIDVEHLPTVVSGDVVLNSWTAPFDRSSLREVHGNFIIKDGRVTSLKGLPSTVGGSLVIKNYGDKYGVNSLAGLPNTIGSGHLTIDCLSNLKELHHVPKNITHLSISQNNGYHAAIKITESLKQVQVLDCWLLGTIVEGLSNLPPSIAGKFRIGGTTLEGAPKVINGDVSITASENPLITKGIHNHITTVTGNLNIEPGNNTGIPVLGVLRMKQVGSFMLGGGTPEVSQIINAALHDPEMDIFDVQERLIDAGYGAFAKI